MQDAARQDGQLRQVPQLLPLHPDAQQPEEAVPQRRPLHDEGRAASLNFCIGRQVLFSELQDTCGYFGFFI